MTDDAIEYSALHWVKKELDALLNEARISLEAYIEDDAQADKLVETESRLSQVRGTLQMVELHGASLLAEEMVRLTQAVRDGSVTSRDDAYEVLMRAILQLPDYLEHIQTGHRDIPIVLLPLLNDLRTTRNASLLSENVLFFPEMEGISGRGEAQQASSGEDIQALARRSRHAYQLGLLGLFRNRDVPQSLTRISTVINDLQQAASQDSVRRLFWIGGAVVEALSNDALEASVTVKQLLGRIDREIRQLIQDGESSVAARIPGDLIKNLLYYVARSGPGGDQAGEVKRAFRLGELLPEGADLEEALANIRGPNQELMDTVSRAIREDLAEVKDGLDVYMHSAQPQVGDLAPLVEKLQRMADTMAMLGMAEPREMALREAETIDAMVKAGGGEDDGMLMDVASRLLNMEAAVNNLVASRGRTGVRAGLLPGSLGELPSGESRTIITTLLREALSDLARARSGILDFVAEPAGLDHLREVPETLQRVGGALSILSLEEVDEILQGIRDYVVTGILEPARVPPADQQEALAEAITAVELYLETLDNGSGDPRPMLVTARACLARLPSTAGAAGEAVQSPEGVEDLDATWVMDKPEHAAWEADDAHAADDAGMSEAEVSADAQDAAKAVPAVEPQPEPELEPEPEPEPERYPALSGEIDEEILEIFLEETQEEIERITEYLPRWRDNPGDQDALTTLRRSYHTLKGSGRLVGALLLGEFAWSMENLLNRVIDQSVPPGAPVYGLLGDALKLLPVLRDQIQGGEGDEPGTYELMARAHALARGEARPPVQSVPAAPAPAPVSEQEPPEATEAQAGEVETAPAEPVQADLSSEEATLVLDRDDLDFGALETGGESTDEVPEPTLEDSSHEGEVEPDLGLELDSDLQAPSQDDTLAQAGEPDFGDIDLGQNDTLLEELDAAPPPFELEEEILGLESEPDLSLETGDETEAPAETGEHDSHEDETRFLRREDLPAMDDAGSAEASLDDGVHGEDDTLSGARMDPVLFDIFRNETGQHLQTLRDQLANAGREDGGLPVTDALLRAVHTLNGAARTAEVPEIYEVCAPCERYVKARSDTEAYVPARVLPAFEALIEHVESVIDALARGEEPLPSGEALAGDMQTVLDEELARQEAARQEAAPATPAPAPVVEEVDYDEQDQELVEIFLEEGAEILDASDNLLERWRENTDDPVIINEFQRQLHTLKGGGTHGGYPPYWRPQSCPGNPGDRYHRGPWPGATGDAGCGGPGPGHPQYPVGPGTAS